jgi:hypothetical protein
MIRREPGKVEILNLVSPFLGTVSFGSVSCSGSLRQLGGSLVATSQIGVKFERLGGEVAVGPAVSSFSDERAQIPSP